MGTHVKEQEDPFPAWVANRPAIPPNSADAILDTYNKIKALAEDGDMSQAGLAAAESFLRLFAEAMENGTGEQFLRDMRRVRAAMK